MRNKREYIKPTLQVVELRKSSSLLQSSATSDATLGGYVYQDGVWTDEWNERENNQESLRHTGHAGIHRMFKQ